MDNGEYEYHLSLLQMEATHFGEIANITPNQYLMWERRQSRWWGVAKGLSAFIKTVRRRNVGKENGIQDPQEKALFMENLAKIPVLATKVDNDFGIVNRLRKTVHELNKKAEKEELDKRNSSSPPPQRSPGQSPPTAIMRPVDSLKPPAALSYKKTIPEKSTWKSMARTWFEASNYGTLRVEIQIQFMNQIVKEELVKAILHKFEDNHNYKNFI